MHGAPPKSFWIVASIGLLVVSHAWLYMMFLGTHVMGMFLVWLTIVGLGTVSVLAGIGCAKALSAEKPAREPRRVRQASRRATPLLHH
jgi:hypothetical protein